MINDLFPYKAPVFGKFSEHELREVVETCKVCFEGLEAPTVKSGVMPQIVLSNKFPDYATYPAAKYSVVNVVKIDKENWVIQEST